ncbi:MAG TPA: FUSC family protein [Verrucomicrobiae bacterium]|jgi:uncharacterized membrane protein YgaE (UPF0421/DUF939 family)
MTTLEHASPWSKLVYPTRTTLAAVLALGAAKLVGLPEFYWAPVTALVVVQPDFASTLTVSWQRLAGTALGAFAGSALAANLGRGVMAYALGIFGVGVLSALLRLDRPANRFAAIALSIVLLIKRPDSAWIIGLHRFLEVATGILAGMLLSAVWPEPDQETAKS